MLRESGISDEMAKIGINPTRIGPDFGQTQTIVDYNFELLILMKMKGIFYCFIIFNIFSSLIFIMEFSIRNPYLISHGEMTNNLIHQNVVEK